MSTQTLTLHDTTTGDTMTIHEYTRPAYIKTDTQVAAWDSLRALVAPGDTIYTRVNHVSRSGMSRRISAWVMVKDEQTGKPYPFNIDWLIKRTGLFPGSQNGEGVTVGGCGMDMTFHLVYTISRMLFPEGGPCTGSDGYTPSGKRSRINRCGSNAHANGDRVYRKGKLHLDGGYTLNRGSL